MINHFYKNNVAGFLLMLGMLLAFPGIMLAQSISCGDVVTLDVTLTADLDCSSGGTALTVGANNITIDGAGFTITVNGNNAGIDLTNHSFVTIKNVTVVSNTAGQGRGIYINGSNDCTVESNTISGLFNAVYVSGTGYRNTLFNNNMSGSTNNAFESHYLANSLDWVIKDNNMTGGSFYAMNYLGRLSELSGNDFSNSNRGVSLSNGNHVVSPLVLTWQGSTGPNKNIFGGHTSDPLTLNNMYWVNVSGWDMSSLFTATATTKRGLILNAVRDSYFGDNDLSGLFNAVYVSGTGYRNTLFNNNMSGSTNNAFESHYLANSLDWVIKDNNMTGGSFYAMNYLGRLSELSGNDFSNSNRGVSLSNGNHVGSPLVLTWQGAAGPNQNTFGGHTSDPLTLNNMHWVNVSGWDMSSLFTSTATTKRGLILNGVRDSYFEGNNLSGLFNAVYVQGTGYRDTLINNNMSGSTSNAFESNVHNSNSVNWVLTSNDLTSSSGYAINYIGTPTDISSNDFTGSVHGLFLRSTNTFTLGANTFDIGEAGTAISLQFCNAVTITGQNIIGTSGTAVSIFQSNNTIIDGLETCGKTEGVKIYNGGSGNIVKNSSFADGTTGISVASGINNTQILDNTFYNMINQVVDNGSNTTITNSQTASSATWCASGEEDEDITSPVIMVSADPIVLWPPNHKYQTIAVSDFVTSVSDDVEGDLDINAVIITSVTSDEAEDASGDGNTQNDIVIGDDCQSVDLRAERQGGGNGRVYTVHVSATDGSGNVGEASFQVHVPHKKKNTATDDGSVYTVEGSCDSPPSAPKVVSDAVEEVVPTGFTLNQNHPNPFNPVTTIRYELPEPSQVTITIYDLVGRQVKTLVNHTQGAGYKSLIWDGTDNVGRPVSAGVYLYQIRAGNFKQTRKMLLLR